MSTVLPSFQKTTKIFFICLLVYFLMPTAKCLEEAVTDEPSVRCTIVSASFIAANGIRVFWNARSLSSERPIYAASSRKCQLRIANVSCDNSLQDHETEANDTSNYVTIKNHTFWMDFGGIKNFKVCIRLSPRGIDDDGDDHSKTKWTEKLLRFYERRPPTIERCFVSILETEEGKLRLGRRETYLFRKTDDVTLKCSVNGEPRPKMVWCKNTINCSNSNSNELKLINADRSDEGFYVAIAENEFGRVVSEGIYLRQSVLEDFEVDGGQTDVHHKTGESFTINCRIPVSVPVAEVGWQKDEHQIQFSNRTVLGIDGSLIILNAEVGDSGKYRCYVTNKFEDHTRISPRVTQIHVNILDGTVFHVLPRIENKNSQKEEEVSRLAGDIVKLQSVFSGRPRPNISWYKDSSTGSDPRISYNSDSYTLTIQSLTREDRGNYRFEARNDEGSDHFTFNLIVHEPPRFVVNLLPQNVTVGKTAAFTCKGEGNPEPSIQWIINGYPITDDLTIAWNLSFASDKCRLTVPNVKLNQTLALQCNITNDYGYALSSAYLNVFSATLILRLQQETTQRSEGLMKLLCAAETDPLTTLYFNWTHGDTAIVVSDDVYTVFKNGSLFVNVTAAKMQGINVDGNYTCFAYNGLSEDAKTINVQDQSEPKGLPQTSVEIIGLSGGILFVILVVILLAILFVLFLREKKRKKSSSSQSHYGTLVTQPSRSSSHGESRSNNSHEGLVPENEWCSGTLPLNDHLKTAIRQMYIPKERLQLLKIVGKGQFGRVHAAYLRDPRDIMEEEVAVKTMKYKPDESEMVELFLKEAVIMKDFQHINVLGIRGITFDSDNSPMVILPYMANGDLRRYILQPNLDITILKLLIMGLQVACGMQYLSEMRFVHRDLAARNCMVNDRGIVKVADFGLSRQLVRDYYRVESSGTTPVPVRWMAPECLEANLFTTMSDVWSFGVLLWELMTRGAVPYPDVENWQIPSHVQSGKRLEQPLYCPDVVYDIMHKCWELEQHNRPSFEELVDSIQSVVQSARPGARLSSSFYQNIVQSSGSAPETPVKEHCSNQDYRQWKEINDD